LIVFFHQISGNVAHLNAFEDASLQWLRSKVPGNVLLDVDSSSEHVLLDSIQKLIEQGEIELVWVKFSSMQAGKSTIELLDYTLKRQVPVVIEGAFKQATYYAEQGASWLWLQDSPQAEVGNIDRWLHTLFTFDHPLKRIFIF
jgi:hypothetical protein